MPKLSWIRVPGKLYYVVVYRIRLNNTMVCAACGGDWEHTVSRPREKQITLSLVRERWKGGKSMYDYAMG